MMRQAPKIPAIICLVALLLLGIAANVHTHEYGSIGCNNVPSYSSHLTGDQHCSACDLFYSGAGQARFSQSYRCHIGVVASSIAHDPPAATCQSAAVRHLSRAPPSA